MLAFRVSRLLAVCMGGALGSGARYLVGLWAPALFGLAFPWATLLVNVLGSFLLGALMHVFLTTTLYPQGMRLFLTTGVLGGFTTYSTFNYETIEYLRRGAWSTAGLYLGATILVCLAAGAAGILAARAVAGH